MKRVDLFEFEDLSWFPDTLRRGGTDYLRYFLNATGFYNVCAPMLLDLLQKSNNDTILDLCSGGGGGMNSLAREFDKLSDRRIKIMLSDKFPNLDAFLHIQQESNGRIGFIPAPLDALDLPSAQPGLLTMFSAIHHFNPPMVKSIVKSAAAQKRAIAFFDGGNKNIFTMLGIVTVQPITFALFTPFFRPFRLSRLFFTYILPAIPLMTMWDGIASILRLYKPHELLTIAQEAAPEYEWKAGRMRNKIGFQVTYLTGRPL